MNLLILVGVNPLPENARVYFDDEEAKTKGTQAQVLDVNGVPEYVIKLEMKGGEMQLVR